MGKLKTVDEIQLYGRGSKARAWNARYDSPNTQDDLDIENTISNSSPTPNSLQNSDVVNRLSTFCVAKSLTRAPRLSPIFRSHTIIEPLVSCFRSSAVNLPRPDFDQRQQQQQDKPFQASRLCIFSNS